ncbi:MAG: hypothetical protein GX154_08905 [Clostridiales bacterium]|nr:hypothetical protein [Clostridiales bacterium]
MFGRKGINGAEIKNLVIEDVSFIGTSSNLYCENNTIKSDVADAVGCLVADIYVGTGYPTGVILTINNSVVDSNKINEEPGDRLVGGNEGLWVKDGEF